MSTIRLLVFDMTNEFFTSLEQYARSLPELEVLGISADVNGSIDNYENEPPDVIFYASTMLQSLGIVPFLRVCDKWPNALCYRLTLFDESYYDDYAAGKGFRGSVPRSGIEEHLDRIVQEVRAALNSPDDEEGA